MTRNRTTDESFAIGRAFGTITRERSSTGAIWYRGRVITRWGIVDVYSDDDHSRYDFACDGRHYIRTERRGRTQRGLAIMASRFAREVSHG